MKTELSGQMIKDALIERVEKEKPIISKPKIVQIFGKVQPIVDLHEEISQKLEELIENWNDKKCDVAKIWLDANNKLLRVYPSYINFCDDARSLLLDACQRYPRLRTFVKEQEKLPEFHRQKATDIMTFPVQRLAGVKLLLERLERKSNRNNSELHLAIEGVGNVLKRSNTVRRESDAHIAQLNLLQQVENIPNGIVYASHSPVSAVEVHMLCSTNEIKWKNKDSVLKVTLFNDGLVLVGVQLQKVQACKLASEDANDTNAMQDMEETSGDGFAMFLNQKCYAKIAPFPYAMYILQF
ncbi:hypothetical protein OESDEN_05066 [Oesophagostomum dentatum]|uniref:DH domain-containing protein n=1 Tax=Oesophagostomum dentatum TaxID=61180 RepID=A0A0B1TBQ4_OESDE|nr:hypothetical protein OESDEN_05066 [Oesophagostomum dentatum]